MNTIQKILNLFNEDKQPSLPERFEKYHVENPDVYNCLVSLAREVLDTLFFGIGTKVSYSSSVLLPFDIIKVERNDELYSFL